MFAKGTAAIYSKEYFESVKRHLNPGGLFTLYVPLYESDVRTVKSELATFFEAFPHSTIWANTVNGQGYDMVFMGHMETPTINLDEIQQRLSRPDYAPVAQSLYEIGVNSIVDLLSNYAGQNADLSAWSAGAADQSRHRSAPAVPRRVGNQFHHGRRHLPADPEVSPDAARPVRGLAGTEC